MQYLVQDIETIPETELAADWKDELTKKELDPGKEFPPIEVHRVISIGMLAIDGLGSISYSGNAAGGISNGVSEEDMLIEWSKVASNNSSKAGDAKRLVDWHGRGFDVPVMQTRCFRYGIPLPWYLGKVPDNKGSYSSWSKNYRDRYANYHIDLADHWTGHGSFKKPHLSGMAQLMGLPGKTDMDGSQVYDAYKEGKLADIDRYCMQDVFQTAFVFFRYMYMRASDVEPARDRYKLACRTLYEHIEKLPEHRDFFDKIDLNAVLMAKG